jgi:hypothetical protein
LSDYGDPTGIAIEARKNLLQELQSVHHIFYSEIRFTAGRKETKCAETVLHDGHNRPRGFCECCAIETWTCCRTDNERTTVYPIHGRRSFQTMHE